MANENEIVAAFVTALNTALGNGVKVKAFEGKVGGDVLDDIKVFPSVLVFVQEVQFASEDEVGDLIQGAPVIVTLLIATQSLTNKTKRQEGAYSLLESCRNALHNQSLEVENANFRVLDQQLVEVSASKSLYRQRYAGEVIFSAAD